MPYTIQQLNDLPAPAVLTRIEKPLDAHDDVVAMLRELDAILAGLEGDVAYNVIDATHFSMSFGDMVAGLSAAFNSRSEIDTPNLFANRVRAIIVGSGALLKILSGSASQAQYGSRKMELFETLDEALGFIRDAANN